ncbi:MAG: sulfotransferase [Lysobacterales bacterium]
MNTHCPIFIVSCARSGSTLLRLMLDTHPHIWSPPELHLLTLCQRLLWTRGILADHGNPQDGFWAEVAGDVADDVERLLQPHLLASGKQRWCEKSVTAVNHLDILTGVYGHAKVIVLYRHMTDMVDSGLRATEDRADGYDFEPFFQAWPHSRPEALANYWLDKTTSLLKLESDHPHCLRVRYEDLVTHPQPTLEAIGAFLEEPVPDNWADQVYRTNHQRGPGDTSAYTRGEVQTQSVGCGKQQDFSSLPRRLIRRVNEALKDIDYQEVMK